MAGIRDLVETAGLIVNGRGVEIGGLLLGSRSVVDGRVVVRVDSTEAIQCEHRSGPAFQLSDSDRASLKEQARGLGESGAVIVGVFRSHMRSDIERPHALADDWRLLDSVVAEAALLVLVRTAAGEATTARLHARVPGQPVEDTGWLQFPFAAAPFETEHLRAAPQDSAIREQAAAPGRPKKPAPIEKPGSPRSAVANAAQPKPLSFWRPVAAGIAGAVLGLATAYVAHRPAGPSKANPSAPMAVDFGSDGLTLRWDGAAKGLEQGATVTVNDRGEVRRFELDAAAARSGRMRFAQKSAETHVAFDGSAVHQTVVILK